MIACAGCSSGMGRRCGSTGCPDVCDRIRGVVAHTSDDAGLTWRNVALPKKEPEKKQKYDIRKHERKKW